MQPTQYWKVKTLEFAGHSYKEMRDQTLLTYTVIQKKTKRKPYVKSKYFNKQKVFLHHFWQHMFEKNPKDRARRLKFFACAIELLQNSTLSPNVVEPKKRGSLRWYRFFGISPKGNKFVVQIKESKNGQKYLLSMFPEKQKTHQ